MTGTTEQESVSPSPMPAASTTDADLLASQKRERVKARWGMLRQALLGSTQNNNNKHSMNSFSGFHVLDRVVIQEDGVCAGNVEEIGSIEEKESSSQQWDFVQNAYTSKDGKKIQFITREVRKQQQHHPCTSESSMKSRVEALLSHRINNGVDNTGNVRVWDAEATLAGFLLSAILSEEIIEVVNTGIEAKDLTKLEDVRSRIKSALFTNNNNGRLEKCKILELGAGQAGLAGLALAEAISSVSAMKPIELFLTDGHPKCVENNRYCAGLIRGRDDVNIHTKLLLWDSSDKGAEECRRINSESYKSNTLELHQKLDNGSFHICLASDCVHFQEFRDGLFCTIARTLAVGGIALLCQPKRGSSLQNFMSIIDTVNNAGNPLFQIDLLQDFHPKVSNMHRSLVSEATANTTYDPNWHRPLLLVMTKLRAFDEAGDGEMVRQAAKS